MTKQEFEQMVVKALPSRWRSVSETDLATDLWPVAQAIVDQCAKAAVGAVNDCRGMGETDLRSVRSFVDQAIRDPAGYAAERAEATP